MTLLHRTEVVILVFSFSFCPLVSSYEFDYSGYRVIPKYIGDGTTDYSDSYEDYQSTLEIFVEGRGLIKINDDWCAKSRDTKKHFINYKQCGIYHKCNGTKDSFVLLTARCSGDKSFNEESQSCVEDPPCSKMIYPDNEGNYSCDRDYDHRAYDPKNCSNYYVCHDTGSHYTLEFKTCPPSTYFVEKNGSCSTNKMYKDACAQYLLPDLNGWCKTTKKGYQQSPDTCRQYYICLGGYVSTTTCPTDTKYNKDPTSPGCIPGSCDVSEAKERPSYWPCSSERANAYPLDCRKVYTCYRCNRPRFCYFVTPCPVGWFFDDKSYVCVKRSTCPQKRPKRYDSCTSYRQSVWSNAVSKWLDKKENCGGGTKFSRVKNDCITVNECSNLEKLPEGYTCWQEDYKHVNKSRKSYNSEVQRCQQYYRCRSCRGGKVINVGSRKDNCKYETSRNRYFEVYASDAGSNFHCGWCIERKTCAKFSQYKWVFFSEDAQGCKNKIPGNSVVNHLNYKDKYCPLPRYKGRFSTDLETQFKDELHNYDHFDSYDEYSSDIWSINESRESDSGFDDDV